MIEENHGAEETPHQEPLSLQERLSEQIKRIPAAEYGVICIPMQITAPIVEPRYVNNLETALTFAQLTSAMAGKLTSDGKGVMHPELFDTRRYAVYDSAGVQVALYTSGVRYQRGD